MNVMVFTCVMLSLAVGGDDSPQKAREKLVGVWIGYAVEGRGEKPDQGPVKLKLTITKETIKAIQYKGKDMLDLGEGTFEIVHSKTPFTLDGDKKLDNPNRKEVWQGIYQLDGDTLKWCVRRKGRPTEFQTGDGAFLMILKRQKSSEPEASAK
jgi:uncharacterized protein (TIGR03067 family)